MIPDVVDLEMRGGSHPHPEMDTIERQIAEQAFQLTLSNPIFAERGYAWSYKWVYFHNVWQSRDPKIIDLWYRLEPYPRFLEVEVTQMCHLKCVQCEHTYWNEPDSMLSYNDFTKIIDQFPDLIWLSPNALGEPFLNKDFWRMLEYGRAKGTLGEIYSNTSMLKPSDMRRFVDMGLEYFKFSFDAPTKETYEKIRVGINFDTVVENIVALHEYKLKKHTPFPKLQIHYLVMKDTIREAPKMLDFLHDLHIDVDAVMYSRLLWNFPEIENQYIEFPQILATELLKKGERLRIPVCFNEDAFGNKPPVNDWLAGQMPYVFPDVTVISCCCHNERNQRQWQRETSMGNIFDAPFREIWRGERYTQLRRELRAKNISGASKPCQICNIYNREVK